MTVSQIVLSIFDKNPNEAFTTEQIIQEAYMPENYEDVKQIKTTLGPILSRGVKKGLWRGAQGLYKSKEQE